MAAMETLSVPATMEGVATATDSVRAWSEHQHLDSDTRKRLLTVLDELLSNVVRHGLNGQSGTIEVTVRCEADRLEARVIDEAAPFNPLQLPPPDTTAPLEERQLGGLGIALVRALSDAVEYERANNRNQVTVSWRLDGQA
jgi:anti-sigma regulatory factor (Ser/Thr protein kinase)